MLNGFVPFDFNEGVPYVSITRNGVTFNKSVVKKLGYPAYAILFINEKAGQIAVQCAEEDQPNAVSFFKPKASGAISVRWNGKDLLNTLQSMMGWNLEHESYRVDGVLLKEEQAMLFDFHAAALIV